MIGCGGTVDDSVDGHSLECGCFPCRRYGRCCPVSVGTATNQPMCLVKMSVESLATVLVRRRWVI